MFRVTFMCNAAKLGPALQRLVGLAAETPQVQPVANATSVKGKVRQRVPGASMREQVLNHLVNNDIKTVTAQDIKMFVTQLGYAPGSYARLVHELYKGKILKRVSQGTYEVKH